MGTILAFIFTVSMSGTFLVSQNRSEGVAVLVDEVLLGVGLLQLDSEMRWRIAKGHNL